MPKTIHSQIAKAKSERTLVRFESRFDHLTVRGYVLDQGPKFFLVAVVSDRIWFDGFECFRLADVRDLRPDSHGAFAESALRIRGERIPEKPPISVTSIEELLLSASREFPLVTIHLEKTDPDVCWIGRVLGIERGRVSLLGITPDAKWQEKAEIYRLIQITRVSFGADYETALHLVGGEPKQDIKPCAATGDNVAN
jgi:hypothetical protein